MSVRRLAPPDQQPKAFAFTAENLAWAEKLIAKYPEGRQQSAVIPLLWRAQEQHDGWLPQKAMETVANMLGMAYIRVLEVATFYTMFLLQPVGKKAHVQVCGTTPCMLRGSDEIIKVCKSAHSSRSVPRFRGRQLLVGRGRVPRRLRERADGADLERHLRGPDAGEFRQGSRRFYERQAGEARPADRPADVRANRWADHAQDGEGVTDARRQGSHLHKPLRPRRLRPRRRAGSAAAGTAPRRSSRRAATASSTR